MLPTEMIPVLLFLATIAKVRCIIGKDTAFLPCPAELLGCFQRFGYQMPIREYAGEAISSFCINQYLWVTRQDKWVPETDVPRFDYLAKLANRSTTLRAMATSQRSGAAGASNILASTQTLRVRREYRKLTGRQRRRFHNALKLMKKDETVSPNVYDFFANIHTGGWASLRRSHGGPNFPGWHRIYLYLLEEALREKKSDVTLPYWDCSLDFYLPNPSESNFFDRRFAGTGDGAVTDGPFRTWNLVRNAGQRGQLISKENIDSILAANSHAETFLPTSPVASNVEFYHNAIHVWVGGLVSNLDTAARDPVFFMLHCFIDYIWWRFRNKLRDIGVDPEQDYPSNGIFGHQTDDEMYNFPEYLVSAGYANNWTDTVYTYEMSPSCPCRSKWLTCINNRCVAKLRRPPRASATTVALSRFVAPANAPGANDVINLQVAPDQTTFSTSTVSPSTTPDIQGEEEGQETTCEKMTCPNDRDTIQNTYTIGNMTDSSKWVYLPLKIVHMRRGEIYHAYNLYRDRVVEDHDIYDVAKSKELRNDILTGNLGSYPNCRTSGAGGQKVYVIANGVSYDGESMEYGIVDDRHPVSSAYVYLPIMDPKNGCSTVILTAHDECGRLCRPLCRTRKRRRSQTMNYIPCAGLVKIKKGDVRYAPYGASVAEAALKVWDFPRKDLLGDRSPFDDDKNIRVVFVCDSVERYPWDRV